VDPDLADKLVKEFGCDTETPSRFAPDNTIELQMPFVRAVWPGARVVAVQVPPGDVAEAMGKRAADLGGPGAVAIGSTDLTHYGPSYGFSPKGSGPEALRWSKEENDGPFIEHLLKMESEAAMSHALDHHSACCPGAAAAAVTFAQARGATEGKLIEHTTSAEVEGRASPGMWVGYASIVY
jgi:AmmeMemoRadiSam system protein B